MPAQEAYILVGEERQYFLDVILKIRMATRFRVSRWSGQGCFLNYYVPLTFSVILANFLASQFPCRALGRIQLFASAAGSCPHSLA